MSEPMTGTPRCPVEVDVTDKVRVTGGTILQATAPCGEPMARNLAGLGVFVCPIHGAPLPGPTPATEVP